MKGQEHLLQYAVFFLLFFLLLVVISNWIGLGQANQIAIEESSLVYTIAASANALSSPGKTKKPVRPF